MAEIGVPPLVYLFLFLPLSRYLRLHLPSRPCAWIGICFSFVSLSWFEMRWEWLLHLLWLLWLGSPCPFPHPALECRASSPAEVISAAEEASPWVPPYDGGSYRLDGPFAGDEGGWG